MDQQDAAKPKAAIVVRKTRVKYDPSVAPLPTAGERIDWTKSAIATLSEAGKPMTDIEIARAKRKSKRKSWLKRLFG